MKIENVKPLRNYLGYFIHNSGYVFFCKDGKDHIIEGVRDDVSSFIYVTIRGKKLNLFYLMIEYFMPTIGQNQEYKYSIQYGNRIPISSIFIKDFVSSISINHQQVIADYNCRQRSESANLRGRGKITPIHIAECLILHNFSCVYCGEYLNNKTWHLDHFIPLSKHGVNRFDNLVPSCAICNLMKSNSQPFDFYKKCLKISKNFSFKNQNECEVIKSKLSNQSPELLTK